MRGLGFQTLHLIHLGENKVAYQESGQLEPLKCPTLLGTAAWMRTPGPQLAPTYWRRIHAHPGHVSGADQRSGTGRPFHRGKYSGLHSLMSILIFPAAVDVVSLKTSWC